MVMAERRSYRVVLHHAEKPENILIGHKTISGDIHVTMMHPEEVIAYL